MSKTKIGFVLMMAAFVAMTSCIPASKGWVRDYVNNNLSNMNVQVSTEMDALRDSLEATRDSLKEIRKELHIVRDSLETSISALQAKLDRLRMELSQTQTRIQALEQRQEMNELRPIVVLRDILSTYVDSLYKPILPLEDTTADSTR